METAADRRGDEKKEQQKGKDQALLDGEGGGQIILFQFFLFLDQGGGQTDIRKISQEVDDGRDQEEDAVDGGVEKDGQGKGGHKRNHLDGKGPGNQGGDALDRTAFDFGNVKRRFKRTLSFWLLRHHERVTN